MSPNMALIQAVRREHKTITCKLSGLLEGNKIAAAPADQMSTYNSKALISMQCHARIEGVVCKLDDMSALGWHAQQQRLHQY